MQDTGSATAVEAVAQAWEVVCAFVRIPGPFFTASGTPRPRDGQPVTPGALSREFGTPSEVLDAAPRECPPARSDQS